MMDRMRKRLEIETAETEMCDRLWLTRHVVIMSEGTEYPEDILRKAVDAAHEKLEKYGEEALVDNDYDIGFLEGKLSALRWVLGMDWDELDT